MSLLKYAWVFLKETRCLPLVASSIFFRLLGITRVVTQGMPLQTQKTSCTQVFLLKDLMSPNGVFSLLRNTEKHAMYYLEYCSIQGKRDFPPVKTFVVVASKLPVRNNLVTCLLFVAAISRSNKLSFLRETGCLRLLTSGIAHRTSSPNQCSNLGFPITTHRKPQAQKFLHGRFQ